MPIEFHCFLCGQRMRVASEHRGQRARCPSCETVVDIPRLEEAAEPHLLDTVAGKADVIDYELLGNDGQYVEITLDPGEIALARREAVLYMTPGIRIEAMARGVGPPASGLLELLTQAGKRLLLGESLSMTAFCNVAARREVVAFSPPLDGRLAPMHLDELGGELICQEDAILCVARGIEFAAANEPRAYEGPTLRKLSGDGIAVLHAHGAFVHRVLKSQQILHVSRDGLIAMTSTVHMAPFDADAPSDADYLATVHGPGEIWLQSAKRPTDED